MYDDYDYDALDYLESCCLNNDEDSMFYDDDIFDDYIEPDDIEMGFNPYMGCYDDDC